MKSKEIFRKCTLHKRIRVLHTEWSNGWGGQEIRIINEMIEVREAGMEVFLACRDDSVIKIKALENNFKVFTLPFRGNSDFHTLFGLKKIIKTFAIDILNTHSGKDTWVGGLAAKFSGIKFIRTRHLSNRISSARTNFINELADYVFTTGESVREDMIKYNRIKPERIQSIPTGIDVDIFNPVLYDRKVCREQFDIQQDEIAIGIIAVLRKFKRHDLFLEMARILTDSYPDKKLVFMVAGDGPQKDNIFSLINQLEMTSKVRMLGHVDEVPELLTALDVFVLSSDSKEGVPQSVMQALLMNKAVVATNSGSTRDLLNGDNFKIINTGSIDSLVKAVSFYLDGNISNLNRSFLLNNFSKAVMTKKIIQFYKLILK
jgi:glycosyltransferase involved in cell wall biosynthesis